MTKYINADVLHEKIQLRANEESEKNHSTYSSGYWAGLTYARWLLDDITPLNELMNRMWDIGHTTNRERFRVTHEYGDCVVELTAKERGLFSKAMNLYWQYLANRYRKEFEERLRQTVKAIGKAQKEGKFAARR